MLLAKGGSNIDFLKMKQVFMFTFIKVHGHELILKCSLIIIVNFISQT